MMSFTFTLMSLRPIFLSSTSTPFMMFSTNLSRLAMISSMDIVAMTTRVWPKMMSSVIFFTSWVGMPRRRSAAFSMIPGWVEMPTVKVEGTLMRMFCWERAPWRSISMVMGTRSRNW